MENELKHYGVLGMKWGVHRSFRKSQSSARMARKAAKKDILATKWSLKAAKKHGIGDKAVSNINTIKSAEFNKKAKKTRYKSMRTNDPNKRFKLEKKAAKMEYASSKQLHKAYKRASDNGDDSKSTRYSIKSSKAAKSAARARYVIAKNNAYINMTKRKISTLSKEQVDRGRKYIDHFNENVTYYEG